MSKQHLIRRPYMTQYFDSISAAGKKPVAMGYAASLYGARRCIAVHLVLGDYPLGVVINRNTGAVVTHMRRNSMGLFIKDTPSDADMPLTPPPPPPAATQEKRKEANEFLAR